MRILHVTTHMGGGVGNALSSLLCGSGVDSTRVILLEEPENKIYVEKIESQHIKLFIAPSDEVLCHEMGWADIVVIHWWHHPYMCEFLYKFPSIPVRLVLWSHVSGCNYPFLSYSFMCNFDRIIFTSKCSFDNPYWTKKELDWVLSNSDCVYGLGKIDVGNVKKDYKISGQEYRIGYSGTLNKSKMHPDFVKMCKLIIDVEPKAHFYLLGAVNEASWILEQSKQYEIENNIHLMGYVNNVKEWLISFDVFGYPLNKDNYATTENSVLEAMSVGLPVLMMNQGTEKYIVENGMSGLLVNNEEEYVCQMQKLLKSQKLREHIGQKAIERIEEEYDFQKNYDRFIKNMHYVYKMKPKIREIKNSIGDMPKDWMLSAVNSKDKQIFAQNKYEDLPLIFQGNSKSSIKHFEYYYPQLLHVDNNI